MATTAPTHPPPRVREESRRARGVAPLLLLLLVFALLALLALIATPAIGLAAG